MQLKLEVTEAGPSLRECQAGNKRLPPKGPAASHAVTVSGVDHIHIVLDAQLQEPPDQRTWVASCSSSKGLLCSSLFWSSWFKLRTSCTHRCVVPSLERSNCCVEVYTMVASCCTIVLEAS